MMMTMVVPIWLLKQAGDDENVIFGDGELSLFIGQTLMAPWVSSSDERHHKSIFHSTWTAENGKRHLIIDGGSCEDVAASHVMDKLKLPSERLPTYLGLRKGMNRKSQQDV